MLYGQWKLFGIFYCWNFLLYVLFAELPESVESSMPVRIFYCAHFPALELATQPLEANSPIPNPYES